MHSAEATAAARAQISQHIAARAELGRALGDAQEELSRAREDDEEAAVQ
jgi:hypothetical protein